MKPEKFALLQAFHEEYTPFSVAYKNFLRPPAANKYAIASPLRVGDHYNGEKSDIPFHDTLLMPTISTLIKMVNIQLEEKERIYLYIPAHHTPQDRVMFVCGNDEKKTAQVFCTLRDVTRAYRNDELESLQLDLLAEETLQRLRDPSFRTDFDVAGRALTPKILSEMSPERIMNLYMQGEDIESISMQSADEEGVGRIKFDEDLVVELFDENREKAFRLLQSFLLEKLNVVLTPSPHHLHCADLTGKKDNVHMAFLIGKRVSPQINEGKHVKLVWLENALTDAKQYLEGHKAQEFLRRNKQTAGHFHLTMAG